ncbi:MAG: hypothetical protein KAK00_11100 [Nanoarchaeota archaeon]|nr:hypothetical protein [Nanoarchaeota archaeon]
MAETSKARFVIPGASASQKEGDYGFLEGSYSSILLKLRSLGLPTHAYTIGHNGTNYYVFYFKPGGAF